MRSPDDHVLNTDMTIFPNDRATNSSKAVVNVGSRFDAQGLFMDIRKALVRLSESFESKWPIFGAIVAQPGAHCAGPLRSGKSAQPAHDAILSWHRAEVASARAAERERIARELHDTLLQGTQGMILLFQSFAGRLVKTDPTRLEMERALAYADRLLREARDRVQQLRDGDLNDNVSDYITGLGAEITQGSPVEFKAVTIGTHRTLVPTIVDDLYRIVREALLNAVRHAHASHIEARIAFEADRLELRIRDDGIGVDPQVLRMGSRPGHYGLPGMRERAKNIGATFSLTIRQGTGSEVEIAIPAAHAYSPRQI